MNETHHFRASVVENDTWKGSTLKSLTCESYKCQFRLSILFPNISVMTGNQGIREQLSLRKQIVCRSFVFVKTLRATNYSPNKDLGRVMITLEE